MEPDLAGAHHQVAVEEDGLDDDVAGQDVGRHHLGLGRGLDQALPGVGGVGNHESKLKVPLLQTPAFEQHLRTKIRFVSAQILDKPSVQF